MLTFAVRTLGCKQNQFDSQALRCRLENRGLRLASSLKEADWIIINTCAVTERALAKARGDVHRLRRLNPQAAIYTVGCGARYQPQTFAADGCLPGNDLVTEDLRFLEAGIELAAPHGFIPFGKTRGLLRVQSGCDEHCGYCIVPSLRGPSRSVPLEDCVQALDELKNRGAPEVVLTGTNIALWGRDLPGNPVLQDLIQAIVKRSGGIRIRLSSLEPHLLSPEFLEWCLHQADLCRHWHFAFQSGSSRVLGLMNRSEPSAELISYLRELTHGNQRVCLGADVIAGFPGETDQDFQDSREWLRSIPLSYLHVFPFSERIGTAAALWGSLTPISDRLRRAANLRMLSSDLKNHFLKSNFGSLQDVILIHPANSEKTIGLSSNYMRILFANHFKPDRVRFQVRWEPNAVSAVYMHN